MSVILQGRPGVATGLAWTPTGGEALMVEASKMTGTGQMRLTGQLGDVIKESASICMSWIRAHALQLNLPEVDAGDFLKKHDIHVHFPAGAIKKDGPSAGVAITVLLRPAAQADLRVAWCRWLSCQCFGTEACEQTLP